MSLPIQLAQAAPRTYEFQSDSAGNWDMKISNNLSAGPHVVTVQDEQGNLDQAIMYVIKETGVQTGTSTAPNQIIIDRVTKTVPDYLLWPIGLLFALCAILCILFFAMAKRVAEDEKEMAKVEMTKPGQTGSSQSTRKFHRYMRAAIAVCVLALIAMVGVGIWLNRETNFLSKLIPSAPASGMIEEINGQVVDPFTRAGIAGADLVSGQTSIRTGGSGNFIFSNVNSSDGIRVTHPSLLRPLVVIPAASPEKQSIDILFNEQMYVVLSRVLDAESRGQLDEIYTKYLSPEVKRSVNSTVFQQRYLNSLTARNITDQEIVIKSMKVVDNYELAKYQLSLNKAVVLTLNVNNEDVVYALQMIDGNWYIAK